MEAGRRRSLPFLGALVPLCFDLALFLVRFRRKYTARLLLKPTTVTELNTALAQLNSSSGYCKEERTQLGEERRGKSGSTLLAVLQTMEKLSKLSLVLQQGPARRGGQGRTLESSDAAFYRVQPRPTMDPPDAIYAFCPSDDEATHYTPPR